MASEISQKWYEELVDRDPFPGVAALDALLGVALLKTVPITLRKRIARL